MSAITNRDVLLNYLSRKKDITNRNGFSISCDPNNPNQLVEVQTAKIGARQIQMITTGLSKEGNPFDIPFHIVGDNVDRALDIKAIVEKTLSELSTTPGNGPVVAQQVPTTASRNWGARAAPLPNTTSSSRVASATALVEDDDDIGADWVEVSREVPKKPSFGERLLTFFAKK